MSERAHKLLQQKEWAAAVKCVTRLQQLKPIAHPCVNQQLLHSSARFERHFVQQREDCRDLIFSDKFDEAERMIGALVQATTALQKVRDDDEWKRGRRKRVTPSNSPKTSESL